VVSLNLGHHVCLARYYASACPSVCPSVTRVYRTKTVKGRIMKVSPYGSHVPLVAAGQASSRNFKGFPRAERQTRVGWENQPFSRFKRQYLENSSRYGQSYY